ncbi:MAG: glycosyltransferase family 1 protein [Deltaproteobacteria bacterium]|nr:glycosyltransferase family 1 protein [Deltaproteobacteria bacterium]
MIVLAPNTAFLSETSRMLAVYQALRARGAPVTVVTHGGPHERVLSTHDVPYEVLGPGWSRERAARFVTSIPGMSPPGAELYSDAELIELTRAEAAHFARVRATAVVTGFILSTLLSSRMARIPLVTTHAASWVAPVMERGMLPVPSKNVLPLQRWLPERVKRFLANVGPMRGTVGCGVFNRAARTLGVEGVPSLAALLMGDLTLVTDVPEVLGISRAELEAWRPRNPRYFRSEPKLRYVGPMFAKLDLPVSPQVEEFLAGPRPIVYVAITSSTPGLVRGVVRAVRAAGTRALVASTVHEVGDVAGDGVLVEQVLPSHLIMPKVDLAVTAGGQGSVQTAMTSGTPLIGIPLQPEQDFNVVLMERHGAARRLAEAHAASPALTELVRTMLADERYKEAAQRVQRWYAGVDSAGAAADAILECASQRS